MALVATSAVAVPYYLRSPVDESAIRFPIHSPQDAVINVTAGLGLSVSPSGRYITFGAVRRGGGATLLWIRSLDSLEARALPGTEGAGGSPFWSPEGQLLVFV
jgi:hypothetical protein